MFFENYKLFKILKFNFPVLNFNNFVNLTFCVNLKFQKNKKKLYFFSSNNFFFQIFHSNLNDKLKKE